MRARFEAAGIDTSHPNFDYLDGYDPLDPSDIESAVAELCRRALREEADRG